MKLYRFRYSPYARKVQMLLELMGEPHHLIEVPYADRNELASLTGGYIYVPVWVAADGSVTVESRRITELLLTGDAARAFTPSPLEGPIWAYADFCDRPLEDVLFRVASPHISDAWQDPGERALYTLIKERKFGPGCLAQWRADSEVLLSRARHLLRPTLATLGAAPFLFGAGPTLADAALYGNLAMLQEAEPRLVAALDPALPAYMKRLEASRRGCGVLSDGAARSSR
jgi:glutathione S-transferase